MVKEGADATSGRSAELEARMAEKGNKFVAFHSYLEDGLYDQYGEYIGLDRTGGWHDAGDHAKSTG